MQLHGGLRVGGNCIDIGLTLALTEGEENEDAKLLVKKEEAVRSSTMVEGLKRQASVSFQDWRSKVDENSRLQRKNEESDRNLERKGSGLSFLSAESEVSGDDVQRRLNEAKQLPSSQYKGVVPQPNGRWGAQIYDKHHRIWLGTFNEEVDAAMAYDAAAVKFRGRDAITNFKSPEEKEHPQNKFLQELDMLRKEELHHTAASTAHTGFVAASVEEEKRERLGECVDKGEGPPDEKKQKLCREHMFDKAVTPSDVGKLNRLVIPKQHAEKYFPLDTNANEKGLLLNFEDSTGKAWRFRYSYWNSSQSYVLTKGWSRFVKEKKLDAGDIVSFERGTDAQNPQQLFISWKRRPSPTPSPCAFQPPFTDPTLLHGFPSLSRSAIHYTPFHSHALNIRAAAAGGKLSQPQSQHQHQHQHQPQPQPQPHLVSPPSNAFPQWMSLVWSANSGGASSRAAAMSTGAEMWAEQMNAQTRARPRTHLHPPPPMEGCFHDSNPTSRRDIRGPSNNAEDGRGQNWARVPLDFMQLERPSGDRSWPAENAAATSFDPSTSKKRVRLFGVNL